MEKFAFDEDEMIARAHRANKRKGGSLQQPELGGQVAKKNGVHYVVFSNTNGTFAAWEIKNTARGPRLHPLDAVPEGL